MFGFIKNLIAGILNFFIGLFGGKKSGYYLELDEAAEVAQDAAKKAASKTKEVAQTVVSKTKEVAQSVVSSTEKEVETAAAKDKKDKNAAEPVAAQAPAKDKKDNKAAKPVAAQAPAKDKKDNKAAKPVAAQAEATQNGTKSATATTKEQPAKVELVQTANGVRPEPVQPAKAEAAKKVIQEQPAETTFAPKYLAPNNSNGRRRPGANMNPFLDMARQVKPAK